MRIAFIATLFFVAACSGSDAEKTAPSATAEAKSAAPASASAPSASASASASPSAAPSGSAAKAESSASPSASGSAKVEPEEPKLPTDGETITFKGSAGEASGYLSLPQGEAPAKRPALIVVQEWWGVNDWLKHTTDRLAKDGYVALAVDLYRGKSTNDSAEAHELSRGLPEDRGLADLEAGFAALEKRNDVDPKRIGVIGWCMGGGYALNLATHEPKLKTAVINYGHLVTDPKAIKGLHAALLGNFGGKDRGITEADVKEFERALKAEKKEADIKIYPEDGHAFMNPHNKEGYDAKSSEDAWKRIDAFLAKRLKE